MSLCERIFNHVRQKSQADRPLSEDMLITELRIDSLAFMDLVMQIEEAEAVVLTDSEVERLLEARKLSDIILIFDEAITNSASGQDLNP